MNKAGTEWKLVERKRAFLFIDPLTASPGPRDTRERTQLSDSIFLREETADTRHVKAGPGFQVAKLLQELLFLESLSRVRVSRRQGFMKGN